MPLWLWIVIAAVVVIAAAAAVAIPAQRRRRLQTTFGPEYDRTLEESPNRRDAEAELAQRLKRRRSLEIVPLEPGVRDGYITAWRDVQSRFVDDPAGAVRSADKLVIEVMGHRGYPMSDFDQRAADVSVDHPEVVDRYRRAHTVAQSMHTGQVTTEDLREAMVHYRSLFERLLETPATTTQETHPQESYR